MFQPFRRMLVSALLAAGWAVLPAGAQPEPGETGRKPALASTQDFVAYLEMSEKALRPWTETIVQLDEKEIRSVEVLARFKKDHGLRIGVSPGVVARARAMQLDFKDARASDVLDFLVEFERADLVVDRKGELWYSDPADTEALAAPGWREARHLPRIGRQLDADLTPVTEPESHAERLALIRQIDSTLVAKDLPLGKALESLSRKTGLKIRMEDRSLPERPVNQELRDRPLEEILNALCTAHGLQWYVEYQDVVLAPPEVATAARGRWAQWEKERLARVETEAALLAREVRVSGDDLGVPQIAALLEKELGVPCRTDLESWKLEDRWTLPDVARPAAEVVRDLAANRRLRAGYRHGFLWIVRGDGE